MRVFEYEELGWFNSSNYEMERIPFDGAYEKFPNMETLVYLYTRA